jgi:hypothetical protein
MKNPTVAEYLARAIHICGKPRAQIAKEAKIDSTPFVSMMKSGTAKLPLARIALMAKAVEVPVEELLRLCLQEYEPDLWKTMQDEGLLAVTEDERNMLCAWRSARSALAHVMC